MDSPWLIGRGSIFALNILCIGFNLLLLLGCPRKHTSDHLNALSKVELRYDTLKLLMLRLPVLLTCLIGWRDRGFLAVFLLEEHLVLLLQSLRVALKERN